MLNEMEKVETDAKDRPLETITITGVSVFVDPFQEVDDKMKEEDAKEAKAKLDKEEASTSKGKDLQPKVHREGVGKYIPKASASAKKTGEEETETPPAAKKSKVISSGGLGDFKSW